MTRSSVQQALNLRKVIDRAEQLSRDVLYPSATRKLFAHHFVRGDFVPRQDGSQGVFSRNIRSVDARKIKDAFGGQLYPSGSFYMYQVGEFDRAIEKCASEIAAEMSRVK